MPLGIDARNRDLSEEFHEAVGDDRGAKPTTRTATPSGGFEPQAPGPPTVLPFDTPSWTTSSLRPSVISRSEALAQVSSRFDIP